MAEKGISLPSKAKPRFFYGYVIVILSFLIMIISFGLMDSYGVFVKPLLNDFGWTRASTSAAYSLSFLIFGFVGITMGGLTDKFGPRVILTTCGILLGLGYLLMSQVTSLWQLYLFEGIIVGVGMSALYAPVLSLIARWFVKRRGLMTGIVLSGLGIGQLVMPPVISRLIENFDWRFSYVILGIVALLVIVIATQFLKRDPSTMRQVPYGESENKSQVAMDLSKDYSLGEAAKTVQFWLLVIVKFCYGYYMFSIVIHIIPHVTDLGISAVDAANVMAICGAMMVVASFSLGRVIDSIGPRKVFILCFAIAFASLLWLLQAKEIWMFYLFAVFFGLANGGNVTADTPMVARLFGLKSIGSIVGISSCAFSVGAALGPIMTGFIFDSTSNYQIAFMVCAAFSVLGVVIALIQRPTQRMGIKI